MRHELINGHRASCALAVFCWPRFSLGGFSGVFGVFGVMYEQAHKQSHRQAVTRVIFHACVPLSA
jgi:hypothetical protein